MQRTINQTIVELLAGDITDQATDAIVNAANSGLILGAGVAGAIRSKGGPGIQAECDKQGGCEVGGAVLTGAGELAAKYVIHAVGPQMGEGGEEVKLANATLNSLKVADAHHLRSIAFPAISTGIFGFPLQRCAGIMLTTTKEYLNKETGLKKVVFCLFGADAFDTFKDALQNLPSPEQP